MSKFIKTLKKLSHALGVERYEYSGEPEVFVETEMPVNEPILDSTEEKVICEWEETDPRNPNQKIKKKITEKDVIIATFCGEAAGCSAAARKRLLAVAYNRVRLRKKPHVVNTKDGFYTFDGVLAEILDSRSPGIRQWSCWNDGKVGADTSNPLDSCEQFIKRYKHLISLCGPSLPSDISEQEAMQALQEIMGAEAADVTHYATPSVISDVSWNPCKSDEYQDLDSEVTYWEEVIDKGKVTGCKKFTYKVKMRKDDCHAFITNIDLGGKFKWNRGNPKIVKCSEIPGYKKGKRAGYICNKITKSS